MSENYSKQVLTDTEIDLFNENKEIFNKIFFNDTFNKKLEKIKNDYGVTIPAGFKFLRIDDIFRRNLEI